MGMVNWALSLSEDILSTKERTPISKAGPRVRDFVIKLNPPYFKKKKLDISLSI